MATSNTGSETIDLFSDEDLLKSIEELDREILSKGLGDGEEMSTETPPGKGEDDSSSSEGATRSSDDESSGEESEDELTESMSMAPFKKKSMKKGETKTETETETETATAKHGHVKKAGARSKEVVMDGANANGGKKELKAPGKDILAKSFSDVATPEAQQTLDVTPFLAAQAETLDSLAEAVNGLAKSLGGFAETDGVLSKSVVEIGRGLVDTRKQLADLNDSLNEIRKGLRMPVRVAPKSTLAKSDAVERFEQAAPTLSKSQTAAIITDLVIKGDLDPMAVSAYEATGWMSRDTEQVVSKEIEARFARR